MVLAAASSLGPVVTRSNHQQPRRGRASVSCCRSASRSKCRWRQLNAAELPNLATPDAYANADDGAAAIVAAGSALQVINDEGTGLAPGPTSEKADPNLDVHNALHAQVNAFLSQPTSFYCAATVLAVAATPRGCCQWPMLARGERGQHQCRGCASSS